MVRMQRFITNKERSTRTTSINCQSCNLYTCALTSSA
uniref:Uncharacterized protein n=1 Tax=Anguilla anguilla TaxID=7936 RepID=A0A0E9Q0Y1_ANGAN